MKLFTLILAAVAGFLQPTLGEENQKDSLELIKFEVAEFTQYYPKCSPMTNKNLKLPKSQKRLPTRWESKEFLLLHLTDPKTEEEPKDLIIIFQNGHAKWSLEIKGCDNVE